jgi:hypothetical protein
MKHRIVPLAVVAGCLGLSSIALSQPHEDVRPGRDDRGAHRDDAKRDDAKRDDPRHMKDPKGEVPRPPGAVQPGDRDWGNRFEQHGRQEQDAARAHRKELRKNEKTWNEERQLRAERHRRDVAQSLAHVLEVPEARAELFTHSERMARLNRILDVVEEKGDTALIARVQGMIRREIARSARVIAALKARAGVP